MDLSLFNFRRTYKIGIKTLEHIIKHLNIQTIKTYGKNGNVTSEHLNENQIKQILDFYNSLENPLKWSQEQRLIEVYGSIENFNKIKREKTQATCQEKYRCDFPAQADISKEHYKETCLERYGVDSVNKCEWKKEKTKKVVQERYGCDYITQVEDFKNKVKETQFEKYGGWYLTSEEGIARVANTIREKYGVDNVFQNEEIKNKSKETMMNKYGYEHPSKNENWKDIIESAKLEHFGSHENYVHEMMSKVQKRYSINDIGFDSSWEVCLYIYLIEHNINFTYHEDSLTYEFKNKKHTYEVDFKINGKFYEVKNPTLIDFDENGDYELVYFYETSSDDDIEKLKMKTECMKNNNVIILSLNEMQPILNYIDKTRGKKFIEILRKNRTMNIEFHKTLEEDNIF